MSATLYGPHPEEPPGAAVSEHAGRMSGSIRKLWPKIVTAYLPLLAAVLSVLLVWATGFTERSFIGTALEDHFYGYFFRSYPALLFAMVYGVARIVMAAAAEPGGRRGLRAFSTPVAVALFLIAGFYPTFGGVIARPGFATGGMSFLQGGSAGTAMLFGAGASAFMYALFVGLGVILARLGLTLRWSSVIQAIVSILALWLGAVVVLQTQRWALDPVAAWPVRPLAGTAALKLACGVGLALLPHALVVLWKTRRSGPDRSRSIATPGRPKPAQ